MSKDYDDFVERMGSFDGDFDFDGDGVIEEDEIYHHGVVGQKWGVRRYQNSDGSLTKAGKKHQANMEKKDIKWAKKNADKITSKAQKKSSKELSKYQKELLKDPNAMNKTGKLSSKTVNAYNQRMASLMSQSVSNLKSPSGKVVTFVAKRGEVGVHLALADAGYDMNQVKNGVWGSGRIAYKKTSVDTA